MAAIGFIYAWQKLYPVLIFRSVFKTSRNGVFSFSITRFVLEILRFFEKCKLSVSA